MKKNLLFIIPLVFFAINAMARDGVYVEFKMTSNTINGITRSYALDGNTRNETSVTAASMPNPMTSVTLMLHDDPGVIYMLNEKDKTYTQLASGHGDKDEQDYEITVIGKEKVNNYNSTHVKVLNTKTQKEMELWLSKDIPNYEMYATVKNKYTGSNIYKALKDKGAEGYMVRLLINDRGGPVQMDLVKAEKRDVDPAMFNLGEYTKAVGYTPQGNGPGVDMQKLQTMTPEERQKYIEQLKQQYQQQPH